MENFIDSTMSFSALVMASEEERNAIISYIIKMRNSAVAVVSLKKLCVKSVLINCIYFLDHEPEDVFRHLPDTLVQEMFKTMKGCVELQPGFNEFVKKLMNPQVTSVCKLFKDLRLDKYDSYDKSDLLDWMMQSCPHIRQIRVSAYGAYYDHKARQAGQPVLKRRSRYYHGTPMPAVFQFNTSLWKSLRSLELFGFFVNDTFISQIQQNHPILQHFEFYVVPYYFTMASVDALSKMLNLTSLNINYSTIGNDDSDILVHAAGRVPNLQKFSMGLMQSDAFVAGYARCYPHKYLTLKFATIGVQSFREIEWPLCLSVEKMDIWLQSYDFDPVSNEEFISKICKIPGAVKEIKFRGLHFRLSSVYTIVEALGSELLNLSFEYPIQMDENEEDNLNFERLLSACPNLEELISYRTHDVDLTDFHRRDWYVRPKITMPSTEAPRHFQKLKRFQYNYDRFETELKELEMVYKAFFAGSETFSEDCLLIGSTFELIAVHQILLEFPNKLTCFHDVSICIHHEDSEDKQEMALDIVVMLILRSPNLKMISMETNNEQHDYHPWPYAVHLDSRIMWLRNFVLSAGISFELHL